MKPIGPYSRPHVLAKLDRRTAESQLLENVRKELTAHVGGRPDAVQASIIERIAMLTLHAALMDQKMLEDSGEGAVGMSKADVDKYLSWTNAIARLVAKLGPSKAADAKPRLTIQQKFALKQAALAEREDAA
jgi:hypothetical protein